MKQNPKGFMLAILAKAKGKMPKKEASMGGMGDEESSMGDMEEGMSEDEDMDTEIIGDEILSAIQNSDGKALVAAIKSLIEMS